MTEISAVRQSESRLVADLNAASAALEAVSVSDALTSALARLERAGAAAADRLRSGARMARAILQSTVIDCELVGGLADVPALALEGPRDGAGDNGYQSPTGGLEDFEGAEGSIALSPAPDAVQRAANGAAGLAAPAGKARRKRN